MPAGVVGALSGPVNIEFHGVFTDTQNGTMKRTFNNVPFGNPASDRRLIIGYAGAKSGGAYPTVTIAGNTPSQFTETSAAGGFGTCFMGLTNYSAEVYEGTIEVTPNVSSNGIIIGVWSLSRRVNVTNFWASPNFPNVDVSKNGVLIGIAGGYGASGTGQVSFGEISNQKFDTYLSGNGLAAWGGHEIISADETSKLITASETLSGSNWRWSAISYAPE